VMISLTVVSQLHPLLWCYIIGVSKVSIERIIDAHVILFSIDIGTRGRLMILPLAFAAVVLTMSS